VKEIRHRLSMIARGACTNHVTSKGGILYEQITEVVKDASFLYTLLSKTY
jgi:hypothetical protein